MFNSWLRPHVPSVLPLPQGKRKSPQQTVSDIEHNLWKLCMFPRADGKGKRESLSQERFKHITQTLKELDTYEQRQDDQRWMLRPRIYSILVNIGALVYMQDFVREKIHDISLPYTFETFPEFIQHEQTRQQFLEQQVYVLTDARNLENSESHVNFAEDAREHMREIRRLGHGGYGWVDLVISNLSARMYARKRVLRINSSAELDRKAQQSLIAEIETMKKLSYQHLTRIVGSYTDPKYIAYLMDPVAEANLYDFLNQRPTGAIFETSATLRTFFGCLAGAVDYLHDKNIRHQDLKPQNVLIKDNTVYLADFGAAIDWSKSARQTTQDRDAPRTPNYMAPEVATRGAARNAASDMWSLGVVFLEIATVLNGYTLTDWYDFRQRIASQQQIEPEPWRNTQAVDDWMNQLQCSLRSPAKDNEPLAWIKSLLHRRPEWRPNARSMIRTIKESPYFNDFCCDDCIERFQDAGFFFEQPNNWTQLVDREAIVTQIRSMDPPASTVARELSNVQSWLAETQTALISSVEEDAWAVHIGAPDKVSDQQTAPFPGSFEPNDKFEMDKTRRLHESGAFYVKDDSDESDNDSSSSAVSKIRPNTSRVPYHIVEDSSSDEFGSVHSDSDNEIFSASEKDRAILAAISEEEDESPCSPEQKNNKEGLKFPGPKRQYPQLARLVETDAVPELKAVPSEKGLDFNDQSHNASTVDIVPFPPVSKPLLGTCAHNEAEGPQEVTPSTLAPSSDSRKLLYGDMEAVRHRSSPSLHTGTLISGQDAPTAKESFLPAADDIDSTNANSQTTLHWKTVEDFDAPQQGKQCMPTPISKSFRHGQRVTEHDQAPQALNSPEETQSEPDDKEQTQGPSRMPLNEPLVKNTTVHDAMEIPSPLTAQVSGNRATEDFKASYDTAKPIFDPLDFIEQTFRDVRDTQSQATSVMSKASSRRLGGVLGRWNRANERYGQHLEYYCQKGKVGAVRELLRGGSEPGTLERPRARPIVFAIKGATQQHNKCVRALIEHHCNVNCVWRGKTPIHWALENLNFDGYLPLLGMLLQAGAEMSQQDLAKEYPLTKLFSGPRDSPLEKHQIAALALILHPDFSESTGIDVNVPQPASLDTALHLAVQRRTPYAVSLLLYRGANINAKNASGTTPLLMAASQWQLYLTEEQELILTFLLEHRSLDVNVFGGSFGRTALHHAARVGCVDAIVMLIEGGADILLEDKDGKRALSFCEISSGTDNLERVKQFRQARQILQDEEDSLGL